MQITLDLTFFSTIVLPVVAIIVSVVIYCFQKTRRQIAYSIKSVEALPTYDKPAAELDNPDRKILIKYENTGNTAIEKNDFLKPILAEFIGGKVKSINKIKTLYDDDVHGDLGSNGAVGFFTPEIVNAGETIVLEYVVEGFENKIHVSTRIKNGKDVYNKPIMRLIFERLWLFFAAYLGLVVKSVIETRVLALGENMWLLCILATPFILFSLRDIWRTLKRQCVIYTVLEITT